MILNNQWIREEVLREISKLFKLNKHKNAIFLKLET